ncbi:type IV secretion system VirB6 family domain protein [Anaplasma phagocytophilum str. ApNP]|uniref:Type IV secretion system VirB6 family domain protein n=1 Tax=Anaplasma phagocytophilum str. ApNP TaxID=1359153 RepID=A0A0F3NE77_ANAPH|nr:type IV secretion system VirB6 family domain protein [Anaplasma phagocytophilum str. ApNP]
MASADVVTEEKVVSAGDEGLDGTLGAGVTAVGDVLEAAASAPGDAALKTVDIPVDKEGDKRDPDEVKAGKKKEERGEIGLIVPSIDKKAELEGDKSEEAPAISGIKQDAVVDSRIIEESRVDDKHYTGEGKPLAEVASADVVTEEKVVSAGDEGLDGTLGAEVTAAGDALEATASAPGDAALETVDIPVYQEKGSGDSDVKGFSREDDIVTEAGTKPDDQDGEKGDLRPERLDPYIGDGSAIEDEVEVRSSRGSESTYSVPSDDAAGVDKHYSADDESKAGMVSTEDVPNVEASRVEDKHYTVEGKPLAEAALADVVPEENVVSAGDEGLDSTLGAEVTAAGEVLKAAASAPEDAALETVDIPVGQEKGSGDADVKGFSREDAIVSEAATRTDDQEKDGNTATELPREVVPEATEYGTKPDDQDGDKGDLRPERLDPYIGDGGAIEDEVEVRSSRDSESTDSVPSDDAAGVDKHYSADDAYKAGMVSTEDAPDVGSVVEGSGVEGKDYTVEGKPLAEVASTDVVTEENVVSAGDEGLDSTLGAGVTAVGDVLEAAASAPGDAALETLDVPVYQEKGSDDSGVKGFYKEDGRISEVTELDAQRDDQEKDGNTATELPREVVPEATEYGTKPDDPDGDKSDSRPERLDPDTGDGSAIEDEVEVRSSRGSESTDSVPSDDAAGVDKHYSADDESPEGIAATATEEKAVVTGEEVLEATASVPEAEALKTVDIPVYQEKGSGDADVKGFSREDGRVTELDAQRDDQEKDGNTATELPREVVPEATEYGTKPDDQDGDKGDLRPERLDPDTGDGSAIEDEVEVRSSRDSESTYSVPSDDAAGVDKHYSADDESPEGIAATETEAKAVVTGGDVLEATASAPGDAALETLDVPVYQEKGSDDADVKGFSREDGRISEVTELDAQRDDQEKDDNTATELPREVVPEATEYGTKPDDQMVIRVIQGLKG